MENLNSIDVIDKTNKKQLANKSYYNKNKEIILQKRKEKRIKLKEENKNKENKEKDEEKEKKLKEKQIKKLNNIFQTIQSENPDLFKQILPNYINYELLVTIINNNEELSNKLKEELSDHSSNESSEEDDSITKETNVSFADDSPSNVEVN